MGHAPYTFPAADELTNNKDAILAAVAAFRDVYPDRGILLIVDELLDYLRARRDQQLMLDLGFLRELGEVAALTPFRFVGGLQETLFESPRFGFVAEPLRRVRDRFEQVSIARQDIAFVVANRLLKKNDAQLARIADHLRGFTPLYDGMAERLDEYARLFPIHPAYLDTFQNVVVAEKREVLKTFEHAMAAMLDDDVPADQPGLISYDHYWGVLKGNPSMKAYPEVGEVLDKGTVLERRIEQAFTRQALTPLALRIVHALGVHRLTTSDITVPLGVTPQELRDGLCLASPLPAAHRTAQFQLDQVRVALKEIVRTVSGQYLSYNEANDQYYLDVKKDIDFDAKIGERGNTLDDDALNSFFFDALGLVLGLSQSTVYVTGHQIWAYELPWSDHKVTRPGYLFFGAPDERSTAQPPRDFYVYLLPPFFSRPLNGDYQPDEVVFQLKGMDESFKETLRRYAGARALEQESPAHRAVYAAKAQDSRGRLQRWLDERLATHLTVTHLGVTRPVDDVLGRARSTASRGIDDLLRIVASTELAPQFAEAYGDYPAFAKLAQPVTEAARAGNATEAIRMIAGRGRTALATATLDGLELLGEDGVTPRPDRSRYARHVLAALRAKPDGQVVNRGELIAITAGGVDKPVEKDLAFKLEPEWLAVVLVALVYAGEIALTTAERETLDAATVERAATVALGSLTHFSHLARPKALPLPTWSLIFENLGLQAALIKDEQTREAAVRELLSAVAREQARVVALQGAIGQGLKLWNQPVFTDNFTLTGEKGAIVGSNLPRVSLTSTAILAGTRGYKQILEELAKYTTVGKLNNLKLRSNDAIEALAHRQTVARGESLVRLVGQLLPVTAYLAEAQANLPPDHPWSARADSTRQRLIDDIRHFGAGEGGEATERDGAAMLAELDALKREYIAAYAALHREATLNLDGDNRRKRLYDDPRLKALKDLASIDLLAQNKGELDAWSATVTRLRPCPGFHEGRITDAPTCPDCGFRPGQQPQTMSAEAILSAQDTKLDNLLLNWRQALHGNLTSPEVRQSLLNMTATEKGPIEAFLAQSPDDLNAAIPPRFQTAATAAFRGIRALPIDASALLDALGSGGLPCTVDDLKRRFQTFLTEAMRGYDTGNTRITLNRDQPTPDHLTPSPHPDDTHLPAD